MLILRLVVAASCLGALLTSDAQAQRDFAPGVLKVIQPEISGRDTQSLPMTLPGLDGELSPEDYTPNFPAKTETLFSQTRQVIFYRDVWQHEFSFLGLRQMTIQATDESGQLQNRNIWYLVYRVRNVGAAITHKEITDPNTGRVDIEPVTESAQPAPYTVSNLCFGHFVRNGGVQDPETGMYAEVS